MFCIHCGKSLPDDAKFCPFCGESAVTPASPGSASSPIQEPTPEPAESPAAPPVPKQEASAPEPNETLEDESSTPGETDPTSEKSEKYRVTFMRWDTSGPELKITFAQGEPLVLASSASHTVMLPGGPQYIRLDTASQHSEIEITLDADLKVNLRWDANSGLFSADCSARETFRPTGAASATPTAAAPSPTYSAAPSTGSGVPEPSAPKKGGNVGLVIGLFVALAVALALAVAFFALPHPLTEKQVIGLWVNDPLPKDPDSLFPAEPQDKFYMDFQDSNLVDLIVLPIYGNVQTETALWHIDNGKRIAITMSDGYIQYVTMENKKLVLREGEDKTTFSRATTTIDKIPTPKPAADLEPSIDYAEPSQITTSMPTPTIDPNALYIIYDGTITIDDFIGEYSNIGSDSSELDGTASLSIDWRDGNNNEVSFINGGFRVADFDFFDFYATYEDHNTGNFLYLNNRKTGDCHCFYYVPAEDSIYRKDTVYYTFNPSNDDCWTNYIAYVRNDDTYDDDAIDFTWLEGEYEKLHDVNIAMIFGVDDVVKTEAYAQFVEYSPNGEVEVLAEGPASYVGGGNSPRFEGYLYNDAMDPIVIEYDDDSCNFTVNCSALGFYGATFADMF